MHPPMVRKASYVLFAGAILSAALLHLGPVILAGLLSYMILDVTHRNLAKRMNDSAARWLAVLVLALATGLISWLFWLFIRMTLSRLPLIFSDSIPKIAGLAARYSINLPFEDLEGLKAMILDNVRDNVQAITHESGVLTKGFFQILIAIFVAVLYFLERPRYVPKGTLYDALRREFGERVGLFMQGFERVIGAQIVIAAVNTLFTAIFIIAWGLPFQRFLILSTFMFGMLPVIGNLISNALIAGTALMLSPGNALFVLIGLVVLHKGEYFLNTHIISSRVDLPTWQTLLGILIGELLLGVPGIILAPAVITHIRKELQAVPSSAV